MSNSIRVSSQFREYDNQWTAGVFANGQAKPVCTATAATKFEAEGQAADKYRKEHGAFGVIEELDSPADIESSKVVWTIPTDSLYIAGVGRSSFETSLGSDAIQLQTLFAGLIEKAKRTGLDHRLIAMANTDFERGFMALDKALTTNKG